LYEFRDKKSHVGGYLAQWRMTVASEMLNRMNPNMAARASENGHDSRAAFSRASQPDRTARTWATSSRRRAPQPVATTKDIALGEPLAVLEEAHFIAVSSTSTTRGGDMGKS
jgi:hypothetical protein